MAHFIRSRVVALSLGLMLASTGLIGCGSGGSSGSQTFNTSKALGQTVITLMVAFSPTLSAQLFNAMKATSTPCTNGGTMSVNPDGSITFYSCSFAPGLLFNGTIRIVPQTGTQGGRIEFDNFNGTIDDETGFEMDGYIQETEQADGTLDFDIDLDTTTIYEGEADAFNIEGNFSIDDDGIMSGTMLMDLGDSSIPNTLCDFEGQNVLDYISNDGTTNGAGLMDNSCRELDTPFS